MGPARHALDIALSYSGRVALATLVQLALVLGPPMLLAALMQPVALQSERWTQRLVGERPLWLAAGWLTTALHELGHAALALLFGHRVTRVKWFDFGAEDGALGQVDHQYDPASLYQRVGRFFIGVGPIVIAVVLLALAARWLVGVHVGAAPVVAHPHGPADVGVVTRSLLAQLGASVRGVGQLADALTPGRWQSWVFVYLAYLAGSAMRLSASDFRAAGAGLWTLCWLLLLVNAATVWAGAFATSMALHAARALSLCDVALVAAIALQALVGVLALGATTGAAYLRERSAALAGG